jgi:hypothetical protein
MRAGQSLRFIFDEPTLMHWGLDGWTQPRDASSAPGLLGLQVVDVAPEALAGAERVDFSCQDLGSGRWIEIDRRIRIERRS